MLHAASRLFREVGFEATTMCGVADAAGVSKMTLYAHFGDKKRLFLCTITSLVDTLPPPETLLSSTLGALGDKLLVVANALHGVLTVPLVQGCRHIQRDCGGSYPLARDPLWGRVFDRYDGTLRAMLRAESAVPGFGEPDLSRISAQLLGLCVGGPVLRRLIEEGAGTEPFPLDELISTGVALSLRDVTPRRGGHAEGV